MVSPLTLKYVEETIADEVRDELQREAEAARDRAEDYRIEAAEAEYERRCERELFGED